ncbi:MAG TPA: PilZ domain-containing protein [Lacipirellulaceae bacterium]|nr:PilZ domain-containing protein [Lacipirellulaceae bacterium]
MLDLSHDQSLIHVAWDKVEQKVHLPDDMKDFFDRFGPIPSRPGCRRAYHRFYLRGKAIVRRQDTYLAVYTADASRQGLCFLSPIQLLPKERCRIRLPNTKEFQIEIVRCRRLGDSCYECGAIFVLGTMPPSGN